MVKLIRTAMVFGIGYMMGAGGCQYLANEINKKPEVIAYKHELSDKLSNKANQLIDDAVKRHAEMYKR